MTPIEYQELALRASGGASVPTPQRLAIAALGLCGELSEFSEAVRLKIGVAKEAGDVCWYVAEMSSALELSYPEIREADTEIYIAKENDYLLLRSLKKAGQIADVIKKVAGHGHEIAQHRGEIIEKLWSLCLFLNTLIRKNGLDLETVMGENIEKLKARYPEGFSSEASKARYKQEATNAEKV